MPRLYLHIGSEKTGSTSIQRSMMVNRDLMHRHGVYPLTSIAVDDPFVLKHNMPWRELDDESWASLAAEIGARAKACDALLLSNETLSGRPPETLQRLGEIFVGFDVEVVMYVREQADFLQSVTLQNQKNPEKAFDFTNPEKFWEHSGGRRLDYLEICQKFEEIFGAGCMHARLFQRSHLVGNDAVIDFFDVVGIDDRDAIDVRNDSNLSLRVEFADLLRRRRKELTTGARYLEALDMAVRLSGEGFGSKFFLTEEEVGEIRYMYRESNREFAARYLRNADRIPEKQVWMTELPSEEETDRLFGLLLDRMQHAVMLGKGWDGGPRIGERLFVDGWRLFHRRDKVAAAPVDDPAVLRFRTPYRRRGQRSSGVSVKLLTEGGRDLPADVTANGLHLGEVTFPHDSVRIPSETCGPYDEVELEIRTSAVASSDAVVGGLEVSYA